MIFKYLNREIFYVVHGKGRAVLLINGYMETVAMWDFVVGALSRECQVICMDMPGHGRSQNLDIELTMPAMAEMIKSFLEFIEVDEVSVCGHSMGGYIALALADQFPSLVRKLVLLHSHPFADSEETISRRKQGVNLLLESPRTSIRASLSNLFYSHTGIEKNIEFQTQEALKGDPKAYISCNRGMAVRKDLGEALYYERPTYIIAGRMDPLISNDISDKQMSFLGPNDSFWLEKSGHMGHVEEPELLKSILLSILP